MPSGICPECGSSNITKEVCGFSKTGDYQCLDCDNRDLPRAFKEYSIVTRDDYRALDTGDKIYLDGPIEEVVIIRKEGDLVFYGNEDEPDSRTYSSCLKKNY